MIFKNVILVDNKLILNIFIITYKNNKIIINSSNNNNNIKIPIYNKYNSIYYEKVLFPLEMIIYNNKVFSPYIILSSLNLKINNSIDFFYNLEKCIYNNYNLEFMNISDILNNNFNIFCNILNINYNISEENLKNDLFIKKLWNNIILLKLYIIVIIIKLPKLSYRNISKYYKMYNIPIFILLLAYKLKSFKYDILISINNKIKKESINENNIIMTLNNYYLFTNININHINNNKIYYIINKNTNIIEKVYINNINKNIIYTSNNKIINKNDYIWYYYHPKILFDTNYVLFNTYINYEFTNNIIKLYLNIDDELVLKFIKCNIENYKISNMTHILKKFNIILNDFEILKINLYDDDFFIHITKKYKYNNKAIYDILTILFNNYNYPLKSNRHELDTIFDYIIYFSLYNYTEIITLNLNSILPNKLKYLYINIIKTLYQIMNNSYDSITYNYKIYNDYLHRNIIKLYFNNSNKLSINYFRSQITLEIQNKLNNIIITNNLLIDISYKLSWINIIKKIYYINIFFKNNNLLFYQTKFNKNIIHDKFDIKIKKIIENPFSMYKFLKTENEFIIWTNIISYKLYHSYNILTNYNNDNYKLNTLGKIIYLLYKFKNKNSIININKIIDIDIDENINKLLNNILIDI